MESDESSSTFVEKMASLAALQDDETTPPTTSAAMSSSTSAATLAQGDNDTKIEEKETKEGESKKTESSEDKDKFDPKSLRGWPFKPPFAPNPNRDPVAASGDDDRHVYWGDLTWKQQLSWRKVFLREYLSETKRCLPYVRKLFLLIFRLSPWRTTVLIIANTLRGFVPALTLQTRGTFILMLQEGLQKKSLDKKGLLKLLFQELVSSALEKILSQIMSNVNVALDARLQKELQFGVFKGYLELSASEMNKRSTQIYFRRAKEIYTHHPPMALITNNIDMLRDSMSIVARLAALSSLTNRHSWPILAFSLAIPVLDQLFKMIPWGKHNKDEWVIDATFEECNLESDMRNLERVGTSVQSRYELTIFGAKEWLVKHYGKALDLVTKVRETGRLEYHQEEPFFHENIYPLLHGGARAIMYLAVAFQPDYFRMSIPEVTFLESSVGDLVSTVASLGDTLSQRLVNDMFRIRNLFQCMEFRTENTDPRNFVPYIPNPKGMKVELKDVSFRYEKDSPLVLKNISFTIQPGEIVSVVGYNGSGRYTGLSAKENIGIGKASSMNSLKEIRRAAGQSGADEQVRKYPNFYETQLYMKPEDAFPSGHFHLPLPEDPNEEESFMARMLDRNPYEGAKFEGKKIQWSAKPKSKKGIDIMIPPAKPVRVAESTSLRELSGGQWQRIALARAFMKIKEADLLLLDEPSSALDPQAEYEVFKTIMELRKGKTTIYISHRLHTVRAASKILLFENGELVEMGTHEDLLKIEGGKYSHLFRLQSEGYGEFNKEKDKKEISEEKN